MRKIMIVVFALALLSISAMAADDYSKFQVSGAYSFQSFDGKGDITGLDRQTFHGWDGEAQVNFHKNVGIVADFSGYYKSFNDTIGGVAATAKLRNYPILFGPRFTARAGKLEPFVHALFGVSHTTFEASAAGVGSETGSSNDFAFAIGGGFDYNVSKHMAIRPVKFDYLRIRLSDSGVTENLNNYRYAAGVVFKF